MSDQTSSEYRSLMIAAILLATFGWIGLFILLNTTLPTVGPRWLFFFLLSITSTGTSLPFIWLLHRRFDRDRPAPSRVLLRQGLWVGLYASLSIWLQINRTLNLSLSLLLGAGIIAFEWFLRLLERSTWKPQ